VLVVEDEPLVALDLTEALKDAGAHVVTAHKIADAIAAVDRVKIEAAVVDIRLGGEDCAPLCHHLARRDIRFLFYSGYTIAPNDWGDVPVVPKPASRAQIVEAVGQLFGSRQQAA
jgi:DNA-binding response OmpR family regulator